MRRSRLILLFVILLLILIGAWLWWVKPRQVDMAAYAPADSLVYLEANHPTDVVDAIAGTQAWTTLMGMVESRPSAPRSTGLLRFIGWTGIGPIKSVILARAQVAVVITDLRTAEEGETLSIKPEGALLIETHTSESRIKAPFEEALKTLAAKTYENPTLRRVTVDGIEYSEWLSQDGSRQIVGVVVGSLALIGTSEHVVQDCLAVSQGRQPSLKDDAELQGMRRRLDQGRGLTFGYVPAKNSARLLAVGLPVLLGRAPGDSEFQRLITNVAVKLFGSLGWASNTYSTEIEDRYLISLQPSIVAHLKPTFGATNNNPAIQPVVPEGVYSVTSYRFTNSAATWVSLKTAVASQTDALSAIVFSSLLKAALLSYGIDEPEPFLAAVNGELLTLRLDENADRSLLVAGVRDRAALHQLLSRTMSVKAQPLDAGAMESFADSAGNFAATLSADFVVIGSPLEVRSYNEARATTGMINDASWRRMTSLSSQPAAAPIITYTNDSDRVRSFILSIIGGKSQSASNSAQFELALATLPYSTTETILGDQGIERITRSPLGQFSTLLPLLFPQRTGPTNSASQAR